MGTIEAVSQGINVGVDLGQRSDPSAIIVAEIQLRDYKIDTDGEPTGGQQHYVIRHVERLPLGTSYVAVVARLGEVYTKLRRNSYPTVYVDATGVGQPVIDLCESNGLDVTAVMLTGGNRETWVGRDLHLPKILLVSRLQVLLQQRIVHLPQTGEAQALVDELLNFEMKVTDAAHLQFGAFKTGTHDDLAVALGLACRDIGPTWGPVIA